MLSETEKISLQLIRCDMHFLYSMSQNSHKTLPLYFAAAMPYMGLIVDGSENWSNKVKSIKDFTIKFSKEEKEYYAEMRSSIKLWNLPFSDLKVLLKEKYEESENYFSNLCKPFAKIMKLHNIFGVYLINDYFCDNTILDAIFAPKFSFKEIELIGEHMKIMSEIIGKMAVFFGATTFAPLKINQDFSFVIKDYGRFIKSPVGNQYSDKFVLLSILCSINFIVWGVDALIIEETSTKLRLAYVLYYYLVAQVKEINISLGTKFTINAKWKNDVFRNCMAHYGIGAAVRQDEVVKTDLFGGLTNKIFALDWLELKNEYC